MALGAKTREMLCNAMNDLGAATEVADAVDTASAHVAAAPAIGAALTAQLTTITIADAAGTPDYAIQAVTNTEPYGFLDAQELISFLYVVRNLQVRLAEVEARLEAYGVVAAN